MTTVTALSPDDVSALGLGVLAVLLVVGLALVVFVTHLVVRVLVAVVVIALGIASFTQGALLGGFFLGIYWPRAEQRDAILGMATAILTMAVIVFAKNIAKWFPATAEVLGPVGQVAWPWYVLIGVTITLLVGIASSFTHPAAVSARRMTADELATEAWRDYGHGVRGRLLVDDDGVVHGFEYEHPRPDGAAGWRDGLCAGYAPCKKFDGRDVWTLVSAEPLHLEPSLLCGACGHHGFVRAGQWVPA